MGERLTRVREERGLSKSKLAKAVGVTRAVIGQWERGRTKNIKNENMVRLCDALQLNERWLVTGEGTKNAPRSPKMAREHARWIAIYEGLNPEQRATIIPMLEATIEAQNQGLLPPQVKSPNIIYLPATEREE